MALYFTHLFYLPVLLLAHSAPALIIHPEAAEAYYRLTDGHPLRGLMTTELLKPAPASHLGFFVP